MERLLQLERSQSEVFKNLRDPHGMRSENRGELLDTYIELTRQRDEKIGQGVLLVLDRTMTIGVELGEGDIDTNQPVYISLDQGELAFDNNNEGARYV